MSPATAAAAATDLLTPALVGVLSGFLVSVPVGPVNVTVISEALNRGFWRPFLIGLGSALAEMIYCGLAVMGFQWVLSLPHIRSALFLLSFLLVSVLGFKYLQAQSNFANRATLLVEQELEQKLHLHRGFWLGFGMTLGSPHLLIVWGTLASFVYAHEWILPGNFSQLTFVGGMASGSTLWFLLLSEFTSRGHHRISPEMLRLLTRFSGAFLLVIGALLGWRLVQMMAESGVFKHLRY